MLTRLEQQIESIKDCEDLLSAGEAYETANATTKRRVMRSLKDFIGAYIENAVKHEDAFTLAEFVLTIKGQIVRNMKAELKKKKGKR